MSTATTLAMAELLQWHAASDAMPDSDITVLMWVHDGITSDWSAGWWDGDDWRDAASGHTAARPRPLGAGGTEHGFCVTPNVPMSRTQQHATKHD